LNLLVAQLLAYEFTHTYLDRCAIEEVKFILIACEDYTFLNGMNICMNISTNIHRYMYIILFVSKS